MKLRPPLRARPLENNRCAHALGRLRAHRLSPPFALPVDAAALGLADYHEVSRGLTLSLSRG